MSEITYCDHCDNLLDLQKTFKLPASWAEALGVPEGTVAQRGFFIGNFAAAQAQGWVEVQGTHKCNVCVRFEAEVRAFKGKKGLAALQMMAEALGQK